MKAAAFLLFSKFWKWIVQKIVHIADQNGEK